MLYNSHPLKAAESGIEAIQIAKKELPELEAVVFSTTGTLAPLPPWIEYLESPAQAVLVDEVYNSSRVFVSPAIAEGFGLAALESMACGCALVTTQNGGSEDYAEDHVTALVTDPLDAEALAAAIVRSCSDDDLARTLATNGRLKALEFDWDRSAERLEGILDRYASDPSSFRGPRP
jgi:glycosyltransferase involved in cell wall biosynthesis